MASSSSSVAWDSVTINEESPLLQKKGNSRKASPWYPMIPMFSVALTAGLLLAPQMQLYTEIFCYKYYESSADINTSGDAIPIRDCAVPEVQQMVAKVQAITQFLLYGSTLFAASYYGHMSDIKGRMFVIQSSLFGTVIMVASFVAATIWQDKFGIWPLFVGPVVRGFMGGENVLMAAVQAYISDCSDPDSRTTIFGRMLAIMLLGVTLGSTISSILIKAMGQVLSVFYLALFMLLLTSFGSLAIPESNHQAGKVTSIPSLWERMNVFSAVKIVFQIKLVHVTPYALPLVNLIGFLLATVMLPPVLLYGMLRFGWTAYEGSIYVSILCITRLFVMAVVLPLCTRWWSSGTGRIRFNLWLVRIGCLFEVIHMLLIGGLVNDDKQFVAAGALGSLASLAHPALRSLLTTLVSPADVGKVLGAFAALDAFGMLIAQFGLNTVYSLTVSVAPTFTFLLCALIGAIAGLLAFLIHPRTV